MLTDKEKSQVRFYLGHGSLFRYLNPRLEGVFNAIDFYAEDMVRGILAQLVGLDAQFYGVNGEMGDAVEFAGIKAVEEIQFAGSSGGAITTQLRRVGRNLVSRLSSLLGVPVGADVYGENGWPGDTFSSFGLGGGGGGRNIPLG